ncbi:MAG: endo-alpha-N-acetylgalactosaminidase family protein, partial [Actinomycetaceae bacterium]|nr:endo-alpha-N-acetylgalactosaminidase family protein [Actinomycetaceae bacterium]
MVKKTFFVRSIGATAALSVGAVMVGAPALAATEYDYTMIPQQQMAAKYVNSVENSGEGTNGPIERVLDGDVNSYWHTKWLGGEDQLPHAFVIDLGTVDGKLGRVDLFPRQSSNGSGRVNEYKVWAVDAETCDEKQFEDAAPVATGSVAVDAPSSVAAEIPFEPLKANCVKVQYDSAWGGDNSSVHPSSLAEFYAYVATEKTEVAPAPEPEPELGTGPEISVPENAVTITDGTLSVTTHPDFPQVVQYELGNTTVAGKFGDALTSMRINNKDVDVTVGEKVVAQDRVTYPVSIEGASFDVVMSVENSTLTYKITNIEESGTQINYIQIPDLDLVSLRATDPGAAIFAASISVNRGRSGDRYLEVAKSATPQSYAWMVTASTDEVAAGFHSNAVLDQTAEDNSAAPETKFSYEIKQVEGVNVGTVEPFKWTYRAKAIRDYSGEGNIGPDNDPFVQVKFTEDSNADGKVDWQDGAIALRDIRPAAPESEDVRNYVIARIPFNIVSQATHPFLRTLDDTKRISLATDNLGQQVLLKGYQAEGHDSAQGDYAGHYNEKAGGLDDLKTLVTRGQDFNATFGIHVNATESYSEAYAFDEELLRMPPTKAWGWMNQAYKMNNWKDLALGNVLDRLAQLRKDFPKDSNLNWLYWDVYYPRGWEGTRFAEEVTEQGWRVGSEWANALVEDNTWSHWANDENYGGTDNKGLNSKLIRFVLNSERDTFNPDPMLGNTNVVEFEGWTGQNNYNRFIKNVWERNLPTKFLQQSHIKTWEDGRITFENGTVVTSQQKTISGRETPTKREIVFDGATVFKQGGSYLLPWSDGGQDRLYYWNPTGDAQSWELTDSWAGNGSLTLYKLTDTGRVKVSDIAVNGGAVALPETEQGVAYVLYGETPNVVDPKWGEATGIKDPGFFSGTTDAYDTTGNVEVRMSARGNFQVEMGEGEASLSQSITVPEGDYSAWAWIEVEPGKTRNVTVSVTGEGISGGAEDGMVSNTITESSALNATASDEKVGTYFQRVPVRFHSDGSAFTFAVVASDGDAWVAIDDLRIVSQAQPVDENETPETIYFNDFEDQDDGYWPFVTGSTNRWGDARTQLAELHAPYSQSGWYGLVTDNDSEATEGQKYLDNVLDGKWSLLAHQENGGLILRSTAGAFNGAKNHTYRVSFDYQAAYDSDYKFVVGEDRPSEGAWTETIRFSTEIPMARGEGWNKDGETGIGTQRFSKEFAVDTDNPMFFGIVKAGGRIQGDLAIDNIRIEDLGVKPFVSMEAQRVESTSADMYEYDVVTTVSMAVGKVTDVKHELEVPEGWSVTQVTANPADTASEEAPSVAKWEVSVPKTGSLGSVVFTGSWKQDGEAASSVESVSINPANPEMLNNIEKLSLVDVSSEEVRYETSPGANAIDGDPNTIWHTQYGGGETPYPHWITLKAGSDDAQCKIAALEYTTRQNGPNGRAKEFEIYVSSDGETWGDPVATGAFSDVLEPQVIEFDEPVEGNYVKLVQLSAINGLNFGGAAEIRLGGICQSPVDPEDPVNPEEPVDPEDPVN